MKKEKQIQDKQQIQVDIKKSKQFKKTETIRFFKYLLFTTSAGIVQIVSTTLLNEVAKLEYWIAYLIGLVLSVIWNFTFNRKFTFKSAGNIPIAMLEVAGYYLVFTPLSTLWSKWLTGIGWNEYLVLAITMLINFATEYTFNRFVVFRKSLDTAKPKKEKQNEGTEPVTNAPQETVCDIAEQENIEQKTEKISEKNEN